MTAEELGQEWRDSDGDFLARRRKIVGLSLFSIAAMSLIALYQVGLLRKVPEPPGFDAEKVNGSAQGYKLLATPDALLAVGSYAATAAIAAMGTPDRATSSPWLPVAMCAKTALDAVLASILLVAQPVKYRTFSFWNVLSAGTVLTSAALAFPEAKAALNHLKGNSDDE
jgi:hypothetical protein